MIDSYAWTGRRERPPKEIIIMTIHVTLEPMDMDAHGAGAMVENAESNIDFIDIATSTGEHKWLIEK